MEPSARYDAIVIGARCAGAATAMLLARRGLRVLAVDRGRYGSDTLSTHALMRGAVGQLHRWGVLPKVISAGTPVVSRTTFRYDGEALVIPIKARDGLAGLYAPRRTLLDRLLVDAAVESGAEVLHGTRLTAVVSDAQRRVVGVDIEGATGATHRVAAGIVIGADGVHSIVARSVAADAYRRARHASGVIYAHWDGLDVDGYQWLYRSGAAAGVIPTNDGGTCIFVAVPAAAFRTHFGGDVPAGYHRLLSDLTSELAGRVAGLAPAGGFHGFGGERGFFRQCAGPGWALVGDAGYFKDPLTAHGITDALRDAELLAEAVADGTEGALARWQSDRDAIASDVFETTDAIASFEWTMPELRTLHQRLAEQMAAEVKAVVARSAVRLPSAAAG